MPNCTCAEPCPVHHDAERRGPAPAVSAVWADSRTFGGCNFCTRSHSDTAHQVLVVRRSAEITHMVRFCIRCVRELRTVVAADPPKEG